MAVMAGTAANSDGKSYFKGQKTATTAGDITTVMDFGTQTVTIIDNARKTYKVQKFGDLNTAAGKMDVTADVKQTGQKKTINGFDASETLVTMDTEVEMGRGNAMKMQVEISIWIAPNVPGAGEMRSFYQKNAANFPWSAMMNGGGNQSITKAMAQVQKKIAEIDGTPVEMVVRVKPAGGAGAPQVAQMPSMTPAQQAQMQAAMAQMQAMAKAGGPGAAAAQQAMARMGAMGGGAPAAGGASSSLIEMTIDNTGFSSADVPDSVFAIPAGFKQTE